MRCSTTIESINVTRKENKTERYEVSRVGHQVGSKHLDDSIKSIDIVSTIEQNSMLCLSVSDLNGMN